MQRIAKEMNYSETTFILTDNEKEGGFDVRIFTPEEELPFAGHPTLGTAFVIQQKIHRRPVDKVVLNLRVGQIPVTFGYKQDIPDILWMKQKTPVFGPEVDKGQMARSLNLDVTAIDEKFPIQEVSTGIPFLIVPLKSLAYLKKVKVDFSKFMESVKNIEAKAPLVFCPEARENQNDLSVRVFVDYYGIPEDPATGSANGCLAGYLTKHRFFGQNKIDARVEQGHEIGRPSLLYLKAEEKEGGIDVFVGGKVVMVAKGTLL
jgi:trans-2,3-dihydro-3-hydroxyanthranilate isomerase